jgi:hypothetical protein
MHSRHVQKRTGQQRYTKHLGSIPPGVFLWLYLRLLSPLRSRESGMSSPSATSTNHGVLRTPSLEAALVLIAGFEVIGMLHAYSTLMLAIVMVDRVFNLVDMKTLTSLFAVRSCIWGAATYARYGLHIWEHDSWVGCLSNTHTVNLCML